MPDEGVVPVVVIDSSTSPRLDWQTNFEANRNAESHFRIFPTLLTLMGYRSEDISPFYGRTIASRSEDPMTFTPNYFAALGKQPSWFPVDFKALTSPPQSDGDFQHLASSNAVVRH